MDKKWDKKSRLTVLGGIAALLVLVGLLIYNALYVESSQEENTEPQKETELTGKPQDHAVAEITRVPRSGYQRTEDKEEEDYSRIKKSKDGREYTPYANRTKWDSLSVEEKKQMTEERIPVLQDTDKTIDSICMRHKNPEMEPYSYILAYFLWDYCQKENIAATEGEFVAYHEWISKDEESFYIELDDPDSTILLATAEDQGRSWEFVQVQKSRTEILKEAKENTLSD